MSENVKEEDDFKLPLRPWLKNHIDKRTFSGLEWIDEKEQIFKIPWTKKGHPGWEKDYEVFKAWAKHRGRYCESDPLDYNKLKGNFRSVLHKSEDFREIKEQSKTDQQSGNYRVFQILPSSKVKENRKRPLSRSNETSSSLVVTKQKKQSPVAMAKSEVVQGTTTSLQHGEAPETSFSTEQQHQNQLQVTIDTVFLDTLVTTSLPCETPLYQVLPCSNGITPSQAGETVVTITDLPAFSISDVQQCLGEANVTRVENTPYDFFQSSQNLTNSIVAGNSAYDIAQLAKKRKIDDIFKAVSAVAPETRSKLVEFMEKTNVSKEQLGKILLTVTYGKDIRLCQECLDVAKGLRILYGDALLQSEAVEANGRRVDDLKLPTKELPLYKGNNERITESLKFAQLGIVIMTNEKGILFAKRLCQSKVWFIQHQNQPVKIERKSTIEIFSYSKYIDNLLENQNNPPSWKVELTVGEKPPAPTVNMVKIVIEPLLAPIIESFFSDSDSGSTSLCYSNEASSVDEILRMFTMQTIEK